MNILTFASIFPNSVRPDLGVFIYQRTEHIARLPDTRIRVIAPVPYFPKWLKLKRWRAYAQVPTEEQFGDLQVCHPRYLLLPGVAMLLHGLLMYWGALAVARRLHRESPFDCVDAHYVYPDAFAAMLVGKALKLPVVVSARGTDMNVFPNFRLIRPMIRWTLRHAKGIIAVSSALKQRILQLGLAGERVQVIPNGIDTERFRPIDLAEARRSLGLHASGVVIVSVGSLVPAKGHQLLIKAVAGLANILPELKAYIIGEGAFRPELEALIRQTKSERRVFLLGALPNDELYRWFSAATASCLFSSREGHPNVVLESIACGTPVVGTRVGGIPEILASSELGVLVDETVDSAIEGIKTAVLREWDREALVRYARARTWDNVAMEVSQYLTRIVTMAREI